MIWLNFAWDGTGNDNDANVGLRFRTQSLVQCMRRLLSKNCLFDLEPHNMQCSVLDDFYTHDTPLLRFTHHRDFPPGSLFSFTIVLMVKQKILAASEVKAGDEHGGRRVRSSLLIVLIFLSVLISVIFVYRTEYQHTHVYQSLWS